MAMSGSTEHRASPTPRTPRRDRILNLTTARKMLPLVQRIVADILAGRQMAAAVRIQLTDLDRRRRDLDWPERRRRYALQDDLVRIEQQVSAAIGELQELGVDLVDEAQGRVGFPTLVNNRPAYFAWDPQIGEIRYWHFADEVRNRTIPVAWLEQEGLTLSK